jgi:hypothetical protein
MTEECSRNENQHGNILTEECSRNKNQHGKGSPLRDTARVD